MEYPASLLVWSSGSFSNKIQQKAPDVDREDREKINNKIEYK
jgi:hypothetical protein